MQAELRVPVDRLDVRMITADGREHAATVFVPPGHAIDELFESDAPFLPVSEDGRIRLYARAAIAAIAVRRRDGDEAARIEDSFLTEQRQLVVHLRGGATIEGTLR